MGRSGAAAGLSWRVAHGPAPRPLAALLSGYVARVAFEHNEIADPPNTGISMGWGWARTPVGPSFNNTIRANYVHGSNWL